MEITDRSRQLANKNDRSSVPLWMPEIDITAQPADPFGQLRSNLAEVEELVRRLSFITHEVEGRLP